MNTSTTPEPLKLDDVKVDESDLHDGDFNRRGLNAADKVEDPRSEPRSSEFKYPGIDGTKIWVERVLNPPPINPKITELLGKLFDRAISRATESRKEYNL